VLTIGLDPGFTGALAVLDAAGALVGLHDTPVLRQKSADTQACTGAKEHDRCGEDRKTSG
jgi:hypothetical protein